MTDAEKLLELSREFRKKRARCSAWCPIWDAVDKDCPVYGGNYLSPSTCRYFLKYELERRKNEEKGG